MEIIFGILLVIFFFSSISNGFWQGAIISGIVIAAIIAGIHKTAVTGSHNDWMSKKNTQEPTREEIALQNRIKRILRIEGKNEFNYLSDERYQAGRRAINKKYAVPGSKSFEEIKRKTAEYDAKHPWMKDK